MDPTDDVDNDVNKLLQFLANYKGECEGEIDKAIQFVQTSKNDLNIISSPDVNDLNQQQADIIQKTCDTIQKLCSRLTKSHKEIHATISSIGKDIDKNFSSDYDSIVDKKLFDDPTNVATLNLAIVHHLLRYGHSEVAYQFVKESNLKYDIEQFNKYSEISSILKALRNKDYGPLLDWVTKNKSRLKEMESPLEFKIHRAHIIELFKQGTEKQFEIIKYARKNFQNLDSQFDLEIQHLMGGIIYLKSGLVNSPYRYLLEPMIFQELEEIFIRNASVLMDLCPRSPIATAVEAGAIALPSLLNIHNILIKQGMPKIWQSRDELPVEIDLGRSLQFHSTFSCPILKQQCTDANPPMRLLCGHLISRDALHKLCASTSGKLKCPYCPQEQVVSDATMVNL